MAYKFFYFAGTHWDREWYKTFQGFRIHLVRAIDDLIETFGNSTDIPVFHLDGQTILLEDYLEIKPGSRERLRKLIIEKRLLIGPWYCMPDEFLASGESLIRNLQMGHRICDEWGADPWKIGYICDIFGHISQMPQILNGVGIKYAVLGRGTNEHTTPSFFRWQSPDSSEVVCFKVPDKSGYGSFAMDVCGQRMHGRNVDVNSSEFEHNARIYLDHEKERSNVPVIVIMDAMDHEPLHHEIPEYISKLKEIYPDDIIVQENLTEAFREADKYHSDMPVKTGELNETGKIKGLHLHLLSHTLSSRRSIKDRNDKCQQLLEKFLEPLYVYLSLRGIHYDHGYLRTAWRHLLQNHPHDSLCGCSIDRVHEDMKYRFSQVENICDAVREDVFAQLAGGVKIIDNNNKYLTIFNSLPYCREGVFEVSLPFNRDYSKWQEPFGYQEVCAFRIYDSSGNEIKYIIDNIETDSTIRTAGEQTVRADIYRIRFSAVLGPFGTTSFRIEPQNSPVRYFNKIVDCDGTLSNSKISVRVDHDGSLTITNKITGKVYTGIFGLSDDGEIGDGWNSVRPADDFEITHSRLSDIRISVNNSIYGEIIVERVISVPESMIYSKKGIHRSTVKNDIVCCFKIGLAVDSDKIDIRLTVKNVCRDHRLRLVIPTTINSDTYSANQAFAFNRRSCGIDENTSDWKEKSQLEKSTAGIVSIRDDKDILAFVSKSGLHECGINNDCKKTMYITLLRAFSKTMTTDGEPGGQELFDHEYEFCLLAGDGRVTESMLQKLQDELQAPIYSFISSVEDNTSYLTVKGDVCVSTVKPSDDETGMILRMYNVNSSASPYQVGCDFKYTSMHECDLLEQTNTDTEHNDTIRNEIAPDQILSIKIVQ